MSIDSYGYYYNLSSAPDENTTWPSGLVGGITLSDTEDATPGNGETAVNDAILITQGFGDTTPHSGVFLGFTSSGEPIVQRDIDSQVFILSKTGSHPTGDNIGFTDSGTYIYCFAEGTLITTETGDSPVETLCIGDWVITAKGEPAEVKWIGRQTVSTLFTPAERLMPVRFAVGSLGDGVPNSDLTVTADHAMLIDNVLVHAGALVNGATITRVPLSEMGDSYTVYHIETEEHEIILANGAPAETFIDNVSRRAFDNYAEFEALYGDVPEMEELDYPRAMSARQVPMAIKARLGITQAA